MFKDATIVDFYAGLFPIDPQIVSVSVCFGKQKTIILNDGEWPYHINLGIMYRLRECLLDLEKDAVAKSVYIQAMRYDVGSLLEIASVCSFLNLPYRAAILSKLAAEKFPEAAGWSTANILLNY